MESTFPGKRRWWTKLPDKQLAEVIENKIARRVTMGIMSVAAAESSVTKLRRRLGRPSR